MSFDRQERMKAILIEVIAQFVRAEANQSPLITITNISISSNSREATVFFTTIPDTGEADAAIFLKRKSTELRDYLKKHARMKTIPHFAFQIDFGERHRQHIDDLSQQIREGKK